MKTANRDTNEISHRKAVLASSLLCVIFCCAVMQALAQQAAPTLLSSGKFKSLAHKTSGKASTYQTASGAVVLRLTKLDTTVGPETRVYLVEGTDATKDDVIKKGGFIDLGELKGNKGNQTYDIPANTDLSHYKSVSIWCRRFAVNFGAATLSTAK